MLNTDYTSDMEFITFGEIKKLIQDEKLHGPALTFVIDDVHKNYEIASRYSTNKKPGRYYRDLLSKLIKTYGH